MKATRKVLGAGILALALFGVAACSSGTTAATSVSSTSGTPVTFGVSGPISGNYAYIGTYWKRGFTLALDEVNKAGGINGHPVKLDWQDSQSDPKQALPIAQSFVGDDSIVAELGDFASGASMAASAVYERAKMVQFAFTASSPDFTKGGSYMFAPQMSQSVLAAVDAQGVAKIGKKVAVVYLDTDWGHSTFQIFQAEAKKLGITIAYSSAYLPTTTDFRPILLQARDANPQVIVQLGYDADGAALLKQKESLGITTPKFFSSGLTQAGLDLAGSSAEGAYYGAEWFSSDPNPRIANFVTKYKKAYGVVPSNFEAGAYDAIMQLVTAAKKGGATRAGIYKALQTTKLPSVRYGDFTFASDHRPPAAKIYVLVEKNGSPTIATFK